MLIRVGVRRRALLRPSRDAGGVPTTVVRRLGPVSLPPLAPGSRVEVGAAERPSWRSRRPSRRGLDAHVLDLTPHGLSRRSYSFIHSPLGSAFVNASPMSSR